MIKKLILVGALLTMGCDRVHINPAVIQPAIQIGEDLCKPFEGLKYVVMHEDTDNDISKPYRMRVDCLDGTTLFTMLEVADNG